MAPKPRFIQQGPGLQFQYSGKTFRMLPQSTKDLSFVQMRHFLRHKVVKKKKFSVVCKAGPHVDKDVTPENWMDLRGTTAKLLIKVPEEEDVMDDVEEDADMSGGGAGSAAAAGSSEQPDDHHDVVDLDPREFLCESPAGSLKFDEGGCTTGRFMQGGVTKQWVHDQIEEFVTKPKRHDGTMPRLNTAEVLLAGVRAKSGQRLTLEECFRYFMRVEGQPVSFEDDDEDEERLRWDQYVARSEERCQKYKDDFADRPPPPPPPNWAESAHKEFEFCVSEWGEHTMVLYFSAMEIKTWFKSLKSHRGQRTSRGAESSMHRAEAWGTTWQKFKDARRLGEVVGETWRDYRKRVMAAVLKALDSGTSTIMFVTEEEWAQAMEGVDRTNVDNKERLFQRYQHDPRIVVTFAVMPEHLKESFRAIKPGISEDDDAILLYSYRPGLCNILFCELGQQLNHFL